MTSMAPALPRTFRKASGWTAPLRHQWLDQWLIPTGEPLKEIAAGMVDHIEGHETAQGRRKRKRKDKDRETFVELVGTVVANLAHAVLVPPQPYGRLAFRMGNLDRKATRQDNPVFGKQAPRLMRDLEEMGFVDIHKPPTVSGEMSSIAPTERLRDLVVGQGVTLDHFGRHPGEDLILLKLKEGTRAVPVPVLLNYPETALTARHRADLLTINTALAGADIAFLDDVGRPAVDARDRTLRRRFIADTARDFAFDKSGRLYGGFWQNMKRERRHGIRLNGELIADLDFRNMFVRLAYATAGAVPPDGDLYAVAGLEAHRSGAKLLINTLFWDPTKRRQDVPKGETVGIGVGTDDDARRDPEGEAAEYQARFPDGLTYRQMLAAIHDRHPEIKHLFGTGIGGRLMNMEAEIMVRVLLDLIGQGIAPLPLHDGLMVAQSVKGTAVEAMRRGAMAVAGVDLPIEKKETTRQVILYQGH